MAKAKSKRSRKRAVAKPGAPWGGKTVYDIANELAAERPDPLGLNELAKLAAERPDPLGLREIAKQYAEDRAKGQFEALFEEPPFDLEGAMAEHHAALAQAQAEAVQPVNQPVNAQAAIPDAEESGGLAGGPRSVGVKEGLSAQWCAAAGHHVQRNRDGHRRKVGGRQQETWI